MIKQTAEMRFQLNITEKKSNVTNIQYFDEIKNKSSYRNSINFNMGVGLLIKFSIVNRSSDNCENMKE